MIAVVVAALIGAVKVLTDVAVRLGVSNATAKNTVAVVLGVVTTWVAELAHAPSLPHGAVATVLIGATVGLLSSVLHDTIKAIGTKTPTE